MDTQSTSIDPKLAELIAVTRSAVQATTRLAQAGQALCASVRSWAEELRTDLHAATAVLSGGSCRS